MSALNDRYGWQSPMQKPLTRKDIGDTWSAAARLQEASGDAETAAQSRRVAAYFGEAVLGSVAPPALEP